MIDDPLERFTAALDAARATEPFDATAAALATADSQGRPSVRFVLAKQVDSRGLVFFTNALSRKGRDLAGNPYAALAFHWHTRGEQVRFEGAAERVSDVESDQYFATRPHASQIGAWASDQSAPIADRDALEAKFTSVAARFADGAVPRPAHWCGYRLVPHVVEFWKDRQGRLHDRWQYTLVDGAWRCTRLQP